LWLQALEDEENFGDWRAGGRTRKGAKEQAALASIVTARAECPFEGDVSGRIDDWLEANLTGDKAESTARAYAGMWAKWCVWAERQQWDTAYLNPKEDKLEKEQDPGLSRIPGLA
jgi:hypothetical protein